MASPELPDFRTVMSNLDELIARASDDDTITHMMRNVEQRQKKLACKSRRGGPLSRMVLANRDTIRLTNRR